MAIIELGGTEDLEAVREKRACFIVRWALMVLIGSAGVIVARIATLPAELFFGSLLLVSGVIQVILAFGASRWRGKPLAIIVGLIEVVGGLALLTFPIAGIVVLTVYLAATLVVEGVSGLTLRWQGCVRKQAGNGRSLAALPQAHSAPCFGPGSPLLHSGRSGFLSGSTWPYRAGRC